tara:strand:- start:3095 stop:3394 length:300 start_codon:yes stop_codon:yes gene_type:complete
VKSLVIASLLLFSINAFACKQEAQFIAPSVETSFENQKCVATVIEFTHYQESMVCPLWQEDVIDQGILIKNTTAEECSKINRLSGYLVKDHFTHDIFLD